MYEPRNCLVRVVHLPPGSFVLGTTPPAMPLGIAFAYTHSLLLVSVEYLSVQVPKHGFELLPLVFSSATSSNNKSKSEAISLETWFGFGPTSMVHEQTFMNEPRPTWFRILDAQA